MEYAIVCTAGPESYLQILRLLQSHGITAVALERPDGMGVYDPLLAHHAKVTAVAYIGVDPADRAAAEQVLAAWREAMQREMSGFSKRMLLDAVWATLFAGIAAAVFFSFGLLEDHLELLLILWVAGFLLFHLISGRLFHDDNSQERS